MTTTDDLHTLEECERCGKPVDWHRDDPGPVLCEKCEHAPSLWDAVRVSRRNIQESH